MTYHRRLIDQQLDDFLGELPAISIEGAKGVGKTSTARARGGTFIGLDDPVQRTVMSAGNKPWADLRGLVVVDEWQRYPPSWDYVRRAVDEQVRGQHFLLTGSATPTEPIHSGAGRIVRFRMRPMTLFERGVTQPTVSLAALLGGTQAAVSGQTDVTVADYVREIVATGLPGLRVGSPARRALARQSYADLIVERDFPDAGLTTRVPGLARRWLSAFAGAVSTTTSLEKIRNAATAGQQDKPAKDTVLLYRDMLERIWVSDPVPGWAPTFNHLRRLALAPKHQLVDPGLACALLGVDESALLGRSPSDVVDGAFLGALFESLVTLDVRVYADQLGARVSHLRTQAGRQEVDLIVERKIDQVLAIVVKLTGSVKDEDVRHLLWLREQLGDGLIDAVVITAGPYAYRRSDGVAVVPLALLGP